MGHCQDPIQGGWIGEIDPHKNSESNFAHNDFVNSENSMRDMKPYPCPLFCHSSVVKHFSSNHLSYSSEAVMWLDWQILLKSYP